jgi:simple sugar transport system permease protein
MTTLLRNCRRPLSALAFLLVLLVGFIAANPAVFLDPRAYTAVFTFLPVSVVIAVPLVFLVTSGEIDLSFPSVAGLGAWGFASSIQAGWDPVLALVPATLLGIFAGYLNGILVTRIRLSSLVSTLGMSFVLRGFIMLQTQGLGISLTALRETLFYEAAVGRVWGFPIQMLWGLAFAAFGTLVFNRHVFGTHVCCVGDNSASAREMGVNVERVKTSAFVFLGAAAALAGVLASLVNNYFWPTTGEGYLLSTLAAVFVGGTPTWGGVGTVPGAVIGVLVVGFISTGIIAAGFTQFYTQLFYGLVIIISLIGHRYNQTRFQ